MTHDQAWPAFQQQGNGGYGAPGPGYGGPGYSGPGYGGPGYGRRRRNPLKVLLVLLVVLVVVGAGVAAAAIALFSDGLPSFGSPDALSAEGVEGLRDDVRDESGDTEVFRATIYPDYAVVDVPADGESKRQESFRWDGDLDDFGGKGTATGERVDLAEVDAQVMLDAIATAKGLVDDPETWYATVEGPTTSYPDGPTISAYATNDFSETVYVKVTLDGTEVTRYVDGQVIQDPVSRE